MIGITRSLDTLLCIVSYQSVFRIQLVSFQSVFRFQLWNLGKWLKKKKRVPNILHSLWRSQALGVNGVFNMSQRHLIWTPNRWIWWKSPLCYRLPRIGIIWCLDMLLCIFYYQSEFGIQLLVSWNVFACNLVVFS